MDASGLPPSSPQPSAHPISTAIWYIQKQEWGFCLDELAEFPLGDFKFRFYLTGTIMGLPRITISILPLTAALTASFTFTFSASDPQSALHTDVFVFSPENPVHAHVIPVAVSRWPELGYIDDRGSASIAIPMTRTPFSIPTGPSMSPLPLLLYERPPPYAGLKNQGATSCINSVLQSPYHLPSFRLLTYEMARARATPTGRTSH
jgi:hypothetical protein